MLLSTENTYPTKLQPLYILQKRALRICSFSWRQTHTKELFVKSNVLTVFQLNFYYCAILVFKHKVSRICSINHHHQFSRLMQLYMTIIHEAEKNIIYNNKNNNSLDSPLQILFNRNGNSICPIDR